MRKFFAQICRRSTPSLACGFFSSFLLFLLQKNEEHGIMALGELWNMIFLKTK
jgi:hypothetical protein